MFVVLLKYVRPMADVETHLAEHRVFLRECYDAQVFITSGRMEPRTGGVILAHGVERAELERILERDPFKREGLAEYTVIEFVPAMFDPRFAAFTG